MARVGNDKRNRLHVAFIFNYEEAKHLGMHTYLTNK